MKIICDNCGTKHPKDAEQNKKNELQKEAERNGWKTVKAQVVKENRHYCPECQKKDQ
jgi:ribosomal protein L44E